MEANDKPIDESIKEPVDKIAEAVTDDASTNPLAKEEVEEKADGTSTGYEMSVTADSAGAKEEPTVAVTGASTDEQTTPTITNITDNAQQKQPPTEPTPAPIPTPIKANRNLIKEQIEVAAEIASLIADKGWTTVEAIAGTKVILRALWIELKKYGIEFKGYDSDVSDEKCYARLKQHASNNKLPWEKQPPIKTEKLIVVASGTE